jgi:hypothetical protein
MTPFPLAYGIVEFFNPHGDFLDPCCGDDAFVKAALALKELSPESRLRSVTGTDIKTGMDFMDMDNQC